MEFDNLEDMIALAEQKIPIDDRIQAYVAQTWREMVRGRRALQQLPDNASYIPHMDGVAAEAERLYNGVIYGASAFVKEYDMKNGKDAFLDYSFKYVANEINEMVKALEIRWADEEMDDIVRATIDFRKKLGEDISPDAVEAEIRGKDYRVFETFRGNLGEKIKCELTKCTKSTAK